MAIPAILGCFLVLVCWLIFAAHIIPMIWCLEGCWSPQNGLSVVEEITTEDTNSLRDGALWGFLYLKRHKINIVIVMFLGLWIGGQIIILSIAKVGLISMTSDVQKTCPSILLQRQMELVFCVMMFLLILLLACTTSATKKLTEGKAEDKAEGKDSRRDPCCCTFFSKPGREYKIGFCRTCPGCVPFYLPFYFGHLVIVSFMIQVYALALIFSTKNGVSMFNPKPNEAAGCKILRKEFVIHQCVYWSVLIASIIYGCYILFSPSTPDKKEKEKEDGGGEESESLVQHEHERYDYRKDLGFYN